MSVGNRGDRPLGKILAVINQKGGVGKTTLSIQLAGAFTRLDVRTLLVDADPQGTATKWVQSAPDDSPSLIKAVSLASAGGKLHKEVAKYIEDYALVIVDCPPNAESQAWKSVLTISDVALIPVRPDAGDLVSSLEFVGLAKDITEVTNPTLQMRFVASNIRNGTSLARELRRRLEAHAPDVPLLESQLSQRTAFPASFEYGDSVHAMGRASSIVTAIQEVNQLAGEVMQVLQSTRHP